VGSDNSRGRKGTEGNGDLVRLMGAKEAWEEMGEREEDFVF